MKKLIALTAIVFCSLLLNAQSPIKYVSPSKKATKLYESGKLYYESNNDELAIIDLEKALKEDPKYIDVYLMLGYIYSDKGRNADAINAFNKVIELDPINYQVINFTLGRLYFFMGNYQEAKKAYEQYLKYPRANPENASIAKRDIASCDFALNAIKNPVPFNPVNLGEGVNSELDEYFPCVTADNQTILFTRLLNDPQAYGGKQEDFYISKKENGVWQKALNLGAPINTKNNEGAPTISPDGQQIIFVACQGIEGYGIGRKGYGSCDLFWSRKKGNNWSAPINMMEPINTRNWETQPSISADGKTIYFIRGIVTREGIKDQDIYTATKKEDGTWSTPVKLSDKINTPGREESVFIHPDGNTLYFSSDGHVGMGGLDIYVSKKDEKGEWGTPVNLGYPINTHNDENSLLVSADGSLAYFASNRNGGFGGLDLYSFELPEQFRPEVVSYMKGKVYDAVNKNPLEANFQLIDLATGKTVVEALSNPGNGEFLVCLPANKNYALNVSKNGYLFYSENFSLKEGGTNLKPISKDVPLSPIIEGEKVVLKNVFFETAKYDLKEESKFELDKLVAFLQKNPTVKIEISGHTDNQGDKKSNLTLSDNRSKSVSNYLISKGISAERLTSKGYGDSMPVADNNTPEGRSQNRRTEFKIISK
jgi:outer membrane protein OmpA-like peptidoglycan-associated protein/tetratricopeptide (TPR) repeat protein